MTKHVKYSEVESNCYVTTGGTDDWDSTGEYCFDSSVKTTVIGVSDALILTPGESFVSTATSYYWDDWGIEDDLSSKLYERVQAKLLKKLSFITSELGTVSGFFSHMEEHLEKIDIFNDEIRKSFDFTRLRVSIYDLIHRHRGSIQKIYSKNVSNVNEIIDITRSRHSKSKWAPFEHNLVPFTRNGEDDFSFYKRNQEPRNNASINKIRECPYDNRNHQKRGSKSPQDIEGQDTWRYNNNRGGIARI